MTSLWLRFLLFAAIISFISAKNRLLENYANKLNSISERLHWRRTPEKLRLKRYRCIEEYVDEHGNVIEEGEEHFTTVAPKATETRKSPGSTIRANAMIVASTTTMTSVPTTEEYEYDADYNDEIIMQKYFDQNPETSEGRSSSKKPEYLETTTTITLQTPAAQRIASIGSMDIRTPSEAKATQSLSDDHFEETTAVKPFNTKRRVTDYLSNNADDLHDDEDYYYFEDYKPSYKRRFEQSKATEYMDLPTGRRLDRFIKLSPRDFKAFSSRYRLAARKYASPHYRRKNPIKRLNAIPSMVHQQKIPGVPIPLQPPPTVSMSSTTTPSPQVTKITQFEDATPETCVRMRGLASTFGVTDVSNYARQNCKILQLFAPGFTCEQIIHFVESCYKKNLMKEKEIK